MQAKRILVLCAGLLIASTAFGQRYVPGTRVTLACSTFEVPSGKPAPGLPVYISSDVYNGSMSHYHIEFGRPRTTASPSSGKSDASATFEFSVYIPEVAATHILYCSIPGFTSLLELQAGTNAPMTQITYWPTRVEQPDPDCRHSQDCKATYVNRVVASSVTGILLSVNLTFPNASFKVTRVSTKDLGTYDSNPLFPWIAPGGDKHDSGDEIDMRVTGANVDEVANELRANGCQVATIGFNILHVKFPPIGMRPVRHPKGGPF